MDETRAMQNEPTAVEDLLDTPDLAARAGERPLQAVPRPCAGGDRRVRAARSGMRGLCQYRVRAADRANRRRDRRPAAGTACPDGPRRKTISAGSARRWPASRTMSALLRSSTAPARSRVDAWSNLIEDDDGTPLFRLVALAEAGQRGETNREELERLIAEKDTLLRELQHRVKNNLQMITAADPARSAQPARRRQRLALRPAGRADRGAGPALPLAFRGRRRGDDRSRRLSERDRLGGDARPCAGGHQARPQGRYLAGLGQCRHADRAGRQRASDQRPQARLVRDATAAPSPSTAWSRPDGCRVVVADDGVGLAAGDAWPRPGKLGAMIVQSLRQNAKAKLDVRSTPGEGVRVTIFFARADAAPPDKD